MDVRQIGEKLGVTSVLEGSVRKVGNRIRITAQLVNVENGYHLWSETYDRQLEDVFAIQDEISRAIVEALKVRLTSDAGQLVAPTKNIEAYNLYLKGRFFFNKFTEQGLQKGLEFFQHSLLQDPGYARAYAGIADYWCNLADDWVAPDEAYPRAKAAAERALQRDPDLAEAITSIGKVLCWHEWDFAGAERQLRARRGPQSQLRRGALCPRDRPAAGRAAGRGRSMSCGRRSCSIRCRPQISGWLARFLLYAGDYSGRHRAGAEDPRARRGVDPGHPLHRLGATWPWAMPRPPWSGTGGARAWSAPCARTTRIIVRALAALGRRDEAEEILRRLEDESRQHYVRGEILAMGYAAVGDLDKAFAALERAFQARSAGLIYLHLDPGYEPLRADPRYAELVGRIGLR